MKQIISFLSFLLLCYSSFSQKKTIPLKNKYVEFPITITSSLSYDSAWKKTIILLHRFDIGAKLIEKELGIIVAQMEDASLTFENKGVIDDTTAWAIVEKIYDVATNKYYSADIGTLNWYMRLETINGKFQLTIDSINLKSVNTIRGFLYLGGIAYKEDYHNLYKSTGRLEEYLKKELEPQ